MSFNILRINNLLNEKIKIFDFYCHKEHIFIPEVRKEGVNSNRTNDFYKDRWIDLKDYCI